MKNGEKKRKKKKKGEKKRRDSEWSKVKSETTESWTGHCPAPAVS